MRNTSSISNWSSIVDEIMAGSETAVENLYRSLRSVRYSLSHQIGSARADDAYHDVIVDLISAIKKGAIRESDSLPSYAMAIARGKVCSQIREMMRERRFIDVTTLVLGGDASESPEQLVLSSERQAIAERVLRALPARNQEVLIRFYLDGESREEIMAAMSMSDNQFRLIKSRAKIRYTELVRQAMTRAQCHGPVQSAHDVLGQATPEWDRGLASPIVL
jgi:RNA polymerase sigma-70 factor, ECF subfamily